MIMTQFAKLNLSQHDQQRLNCCRMFLKVTSLADICSSDGKTVMRQFKTCNEKTATKLKISQLEWPFQCNPKETTWKIWRNAIKRAINTYGDRLEEPMGQWKTNEDYDKLYDSNTNTILIYDNLQWKNTKS